MSNLKFENLSRSPMEAGAAPKWQREIMEQVEREFSDQARKVNEEFKRDLLEALADENRLAGPISRTIERTTPRFAWIKNISTPAGGACDAQIDLLHLTVDFVKI